MQRRSTQAKDETCRHCYQCTEEAVLYPCSCKTGVHSSCLTDWYKQKKSTTCAVCLQNYHGLRLRKTPNWNAILNAFVLFPLALGLNFVFMYGLSPNFTKFKQEDDSHSLASLCTMIYFTVQIAFFFSCYFELGQRDAANLRSWCHMLCFNFLAQFVGCWNARVYSPDYFTFVCGSLKCLFWGMICLLLYEAGKCGIERLTDVKFEIKTGNVV